MTYTSAMMSELEAVNLLLVAAEEAPVADLTATGLFPLDKARGILAETMRTVQSIGWVFNTEDCFPLVRQPDGSIPVPDTLLKYDPDIELLTRMGPVQRGRRMYDAKAHSFTFKEDLKGTATFLLAWDDLPQPARQYIAIRAARTMQGRSSVGDSTYRYSQDDETEALTAMGQYEADAGNHNALRDSWSVAMNVADRDLY